MNFNRSSRLSTEPRGFGRFPHVLFLLPIMVLVFAGCDLRQVVINQPFDPQKLETLSPGKSSLQDVVEILGAPDDISAKPDGMVLRYRYANFKTMLVNFGWIFRFFLPVAPSMNLGRGEDVPQVLHVAMNRDDKFDQ